ncbi:hypothetical protein J3R30DRAFT_3281636 [Lentinula aciculospora]|uniref:Cora-domain-containing protein n=1 Tax=Lentinula aciculospora TaxID=153920 RepID=A0A9W9DVE3_9AGAR|nr:hypothetical protein J3R30DRAFT_3281636 [Lentinula aciculospora]
MQHSTERPPVKPLPSFEVGRDTPTQIYDTTANNITETESDDIYRGSPPAPHSPNSDDDDSSSTSSSSSWSLFNGRLGAFTNLVSTLEQAISGWRGNSSSTSSTSSRSSIATVTRSQLSRRRKRRGSTSYLKRQHSERDFSARISLIKAREESRIVPRQFSLYLAPSLRSAGDTLHQKSREVNSPYSQKVLWTSSLDPVLSQLDAVLKKTTKTRRNRKDLASSRNSPEINGEPHQHLMLPENLKAPSRAASFTDLAALRKSKKGKARDVAEVVSDAEKYVPAHNPWFLDVASPTSDDMRAIGKASRHLLLHLHPLTLEDILQQDPREKLERFPKLGYYFISFRAIESRTPGTKFEHQLDFVSDTGGDEGLLMESNVYLVVFNEGVCSFHFMDASEHIDRVRNRIISLEKTINMSSAWIAHSLLDSIVDSFFPFTDEIEKEVMAMEQLVYPSDNTAATFDIPAKSNNIVPEKVFSEEEPLPALSEKNLLKFESSSTGTRTHFALPRPPLPLLYRRFLRYIRYFWRPTPSNEKSAPSPTMITLRRMARTRRLVTSLTRLLATKSDVVAQIRKRLLTGSGNGNASNSEEEVAMYMGDVQDHILSLQHSLAHYERMLSQSHPTYLQQLRTHVSLTKSGADKALVYLTTVSMAVLCLQTVIGMFSQNVNVPASQDSFHVFGIIISVECVVLTVYLGVVRRWWLNAKKRRGKALG